LAAQERRVLELKEELGRAEAALKKLKNEWAVHEAQKKRQDVRKVQKLRPLSATMPSLGQQEDDPSGASAWVTQEMERRKAILNGVKTSNRKVFSGSRHARALSLLTPDTLNAASDMQADSGARSTHRQTMDPRPSLPNMPSTDADPTTRLPEITDNMDLGIPREVLMKTGRQMASDFKDGLWTFIEDLRQVTVGEEGITGAQQRTQPKANGTNDQRTPRRNQSVSSTGRSARKPQPTRQQSTTDMSGRSRSSPMKIQREESENLMDVGGSFWTANGLGEVKPVDEVKKSSNKSATPIKTFHKSSGSIDSWDNWDSPAVENTPKLVRSDSDASTIEQIGSPPSNAGTTPRTSIR
jgi:hypothetical protein